MRGRARTHNLLRLAVTAGLAAAVLGIGPARGAPATAPTLPVVRQPVTVPAADPPADPPASRGLATTDTGARAQLATVNATTQDCPGTSRDESRLGLMQHTAMYTHCDYP